jgi:acyl-CoA synthetase (AMP-forming)/AMP-acid ligase II
MVIRMGDDRTPGMLNYDDVLALAAPGMDVAAALDALGAGLSCHDAINIQFTSGTTGNPKGATLTHHNVVNNARFMAQAMRSPSTTACASRCRCTTASAWCWGAGLRHGRHDGVPGRVVSTPWPRCRP